jgi:hypothetical protein
MLLRIARRTGGLARRALAGCSRRPQGAGAVAAASMLMYVNSDDGN